MYRLCLSKQIRGDVKCSLHLFYKLIIKIKRTNYDSGYKNKDIQSSIYAQFELLGNLAFKIKRKGAMSQKC